MAKLKDLLKNKKIVFYGDSITHNWEKYTHDLVLTHPEDPDYKYGLGYGHVKMLNDVCHFKSIDNFAVSGGCYANCMDINPNRATFRHFPYQVTHSKEALEKADVIFVMFGTNDFSEQVPFGDYKDIAKDENQTDMTFYQGMNFGFRKIKEANPNALILVVNCLNRMVDIEANRSFNYSLNEYNLAIRHICNIYKLHLIDVSNLFVIPDNFVGGKGVTYTDDGLHPNNEGYKCFTEFLLNYEIDY